MLHFDERGVSRKYNVSMTGRELKWWRDEPSFRQRFTVRTAADGNKMVSQAKCPPTAPLGSPIWR